MGAANGSSGTAELDRACPRDARRRAVVGGAPGHGGGRPFARRFAANGHELLLVNNPATLSRYPLATLTNLETSVDAVAEKMDRDNDILFLLLTSHGTDDHLLYVAMDPLPLDSIAPEDLADVFAKAKIRYKVIVISACYSGGFIDALKDDTTMIVTAARADRCRM